MLTSEEALGINKVMKVDPTSKTPYSDATQVGLNILSRFVVRRCMMFHFSILEGKCRVGKLLSYPESFWWQNCPLDVHFLRLTTCTQII